MQLQFCLAGFCSKTKMKLNLLSHHRRRMTKIFCLYDSEKTEVPILVKGKPQILQQSSLFSWHEFTDLKGETEKGQQQGGHVNLCRGARGHFPEHSFIWRAACASQVITSSKGWWVKCSVLVKWRLSSSVSSAGLIALSESKAKGGDGASWISAQEKLRF